MKMKKYIKGIWLTVALCLTICGLPVSAKENDELKKVRVGYLIYEGYQEGEGDLHKTGYGYDYLQQVAYYAGWEYEYVNGSFSDLMQMLKDGEIDIMGNISYTEERAKEIDYGSEEQGKEYYYLFVREDRPDIVATDPSSFNGIRVGINKGSVQVELFEDWCEENGVACEVALYESSADRYEDMDKGNLDAIVSTDLAGNNAKNYKWHSVVKVGSSPYYFAVNKRRPDILQELNDAATRILQSDWYYNEKIYLKYYGKETVSSSGLSTEESEWVKEKKVLQIGYMDNCLPYADRDDETGEITGLLPAFVEHIEKQYGIRVEMTMFDSYEEMQGALFDGTVDTIFPAYGDYWVAEENGFMITDPLAASYLMIAFSGVYNEETSSVIAITDTNPMQQFYVKEHYPDAQIVKCGSMKECIKTVVSGKATGTLICSDTYYAYRNELEDMADFGINNTGYDTAVSFAVRRDDIETLTFLKKGIAGMDDTMVNEALIAGGQVNSEMSVEQFLKKHVILVLGVVGTIFVLVVGFFLYYIYASRRNLTLTKSNSELSEKAYIDLATGIPNKNKCKEMLSSPLSVTVPTAVYMLDLNDLKLVNDTLGHEMGDLMIMNFAKLLRQSVPKRHFVGRFGGDEFIVIAENIADKNEAEGLLKMIHNIVLKFNTSDGEVNLGYACGYAFSGDYEGKINLMGLLDIADKNMYEDKEIVKRNRRSQKS